MTICFEAPQTNEEDSAICFSSTSDSIEESSTSHSSQNDNSPQRKTTHKLSVKNLTHTNHANVSTCFSFFRGPKPVRTLDSVSFTARSSEILAIVGPSGAGKSTLLSVVAGRANNGVKFDPDTISLNDRVVTEPSELRRLCGFVPQEDALLPLLTVRETLAFASECRLRGASHEEREATVERLMSELGLLGVGDTFVGDGESRGISGGERKRVSIGVEMINDPGILLLDEPTSGLDSSSALQVVELLSMAAREKHRTVILSIHQPSYRILQYISTFLILSRGRVVHNGTLPSLEAAITQAGALIPAQLNPLEFAMEIIHTLEDHYTEPLPDPQWPHREEQSDSDVPKSSVEFCTSNVSEILFLCSRFWKIIFRTKQLFLARTMQAIVGGFGLGSVYVKAGKDEAGIAERLGLFAFSLSFLLSSTVEALPIFLQERKVLMKEASRGAYRVSSYVIANALVFSPFLLVVAVLFAIPVYWIVGLNPSLSAFALFVFFVWQILLMASSLVLFLSAVSPDFVSGNSLICTVLGAFFLFSGYFIPKERIPKYWLFMYYVSLYRYPLDSLLANEYLGRDDCFASVGQKCLLTGDGVLKNRGLDGDPRWVNVGIMFGFFVLYRVLCWMILSRRVSRTTM